MKNKKIIILIIGILLSISICSYGYIKQKNIKSTNQKNLLIAQEKIKNEKEADKIKLEEINKEISTLQPQKDKESTYCREHDFTGSDYLICINKVMKKYEKLTDLKNKKNELEKKEYKLQYKEIDYTKYNYTYNISLVVFTLSIIMFLIFNKNK